MTAPRQATNITFDEISIGDTASFRRTVTEDLVDMFAAVSGDHNPVHLDAEFAAGTQFGQRIAHGMIAGAFISAAIATEMPGPGTIYLGQEVQFRAPVFLGDELTVNLEVTDKHESKPWVTLSTVVVNQEGKAVVKGEAKVMAPTTKQTVTLTAPKQTV